MLKGNAAALLLIEVTDEPVEPGRPYTDKSTGMTKPPVARQNAYIHQGRSYPIPFKLTVDQAYGPHRPGFYFIGGECFKSGQYRPEFDDRRLQLIPVADAVAGLAEAGLTEPAPKLKAAS